MNNLILTADSYKTSHFALYNPNATHMHSYIESRGGKFDKTVFFGLQMYLKQYLSVPITNAMIDEAEYFIHMHGLPFNRKGWEIIVNEFSGYLPLKIRAVPEGTVIPTHNVLVTIENTDERFVWLPQYIETALLRAIWYPTTVATLSWHMKQAVMQALLQTCDAPETQIAFRVHDFGARAATSSESAAIGGAAHLVNFMGSDTMEGTLAARQYYGANMAGFSIPASEHSIVCSFGPDGERASFETMLNVYGGPDKIIAQVSDTYDLFGSIQNLWNDQLKEKVLALGGTVVVRPDSGDPTIIPIQTIDMLAQAYGYTVNNKGFRVLNPAIRVIQGDGVNLDSMKVIMANLTAAGYSTENLAFGVGGALLQMVNRDTQQFAQKASAVFINGKWQGISKNPVTDPGKRSKEGRLALLKSDDGCYQTVAYQGQLPSNDVLRNVWLNGKLLVDDSFDLIRERSNG